MKREKNLFVRIPLWDNLLEATAKALRGKRHKADAREWLQDLDGNLSLLSREIASGEIRVGKATEFYIHDPKKRLITAPCFRERVLHHAIMNLCEPAFERRLIHHTYACRRGKGQFAALAAARRFSIGREWFLQMDVRKYFESIPKSLLIEKLGGIFAEAGVKGLFRSIIEAHRPGEHCGLPIGSLISQHCANYYLAAVDRLVTGEQGVGSYVRYMDDFIVWHHEKKRLLHVREKIRERLEILGLEFKREPAINRSRHGIDFLGHRIWNDGVIPNRSSRRRFRRRLHWLEEALGENRIHEDDAQRRATALCAFVGHFGGASWRKSAMMPFGGGPWPRTG